MFWQRINIENGKTNIKLSNLIAPSFYSVHSDLKQQNYTHYWLKGGRGSTKSSFISVELISGIMSNPLANAIVLRKVGTTLKDSVYEQLEWAIKELGVEKYWRSKISPLELIYTPTGNRIVFRGADKPKKIKSTKFRKGYAKYIWYEEIDEFRGMEEIRTINQSLMRGGESFCVFYSYNPPQSQRNWVNEEVLSEGNERLDRLVHHSTYLTVPRHWLGEQFLLEAEHLKKTKPAAYEHEYMGIVTGTGGEVFKNLTIRKIADDEIKGFDNIARGLDWGYAVDPLHYTVNHYDKTRKKIYIFHEIQLVNLSNQKAAELIKNENKGNKLIICDCAEPKSIAELSSYGIRVVGARKGPDSVEYGVKWLQDLEEIIIDPIRCPNTAREFLNYELEKDGNGNWRAKFPDKDNHCLSGDTIINTVNGDYPIKDLMGREGMVHCFDLNNKKPTISKFFDVHITGENYLYRIELEDGTSIKATSEHPILTQRGWILAKNLTKKDSILKIR